MIDIILTFFLGWAGYWKFKNGKIVLGLVWLFTFGMFGIGWLYDFICACIACTKSIQSAQKKPTAPTNQPLPPPVSTPLPEPQPIVDAVPLQTVEQPVVPVPPVPAPQIETITEQQNEPDEIIQKENPPASDMQEDEAVEQEGDDIDITFQIGIRKAVTEDPEPEVIPELSRLDFGKPVGELGCFLNYSLFQVFGTRESGYHGYTIRTGRTAEDAIRKVIQDPEIGLAPPYDAEAIPFEPPTERQLGVLKKIHMNIPAGLTKEDCKSIISRIYDEDERNGPEKWLVDIADGFGTEFSAFISHAVLFREVVYQADLRHKAILYSYCVYCFDSAKNISNLFADPNKDAFFAFADIVLADKTLIDSLDARESDDYLKPNKGTKIYKTALAYCRSNIHE